MPEIGQRLDQEFQSLFPLSSILIPFLPYFHFPSTLNSLTSTLRPPCVCSLLCFGSSFHSNTLCCKKITGLSWFFMKSLTVDVLYRRRVRKRKFRGCAYRRYQTSRTRASSHSPHSLYYYWRLGIESVLRKLIDREEIYDVNNIAGI